MLDYLGFIQSESARFSGLLHDSDPTADVPSCPDWSMADLGWHLAEVQYFWASIVAGLLDGPESVPDLDRPADTELPALFDAQSASLIAALQARDPNDECWSWDEHGGSVAWVLRRQTHEALIHRVDAELAAESRSPIYESLATDGVDEVLTTMLDCAGIPDWSRFEPDGTTAAMAVGSRVWEMHLGRFRGVSPNTGNSYDDPAVLLSPIDGEPDLTVSGSGADLDLWLWGRGGTEALTITGDNSLLEVIRAAAVAATQ